MDSKQRQALKHVRLDFEKKFKEHLITFCESFAKELHGKITEQATDLVSYIGYGEQSWRLGDSEGFVNNLAIELLINSDPSGDYDGYNRWDEFENMNEKEF